MNVRRRHTVVTLALTGFLGALLLVWIAVMAVVFG